MPWKDMTLGEPPKYYSDVYDGGREKEKVQAPAQLHQHAWRCWLIVEAVAAAAAAATAAAAAACSDYAIALSWVQFKACCAMSNPMPAPVAACAAWRLFGLMQA